jgi:hypothetical protein
MRLIHCQRSRSGCKGGEAGVSRAAAGALGIEWVPGISFEMFKNGAPKPLKLVMKHEAITSEAERVAYAFRSMTRIRKCLAQGAC